MLAPTSQIYAKAVRFALERTEFYRAAGRRRGRRSCLPRPPSALEQLAGRAAIPGATANGLVVRGYRSRIDDSAQPYGLVDSRIARLEPQAGAALRLAARPQRQADRSALHRRARSGKPGQLQLDDAIVLHPFGRSCLGWKSTAEIDVLEAIEAVSSHYPIDPDRIVLMGFSMGGAGAWHLGAHYAERWAGVHAGAGFVDVARYQHLAPDDLSARYEQTLWGVYDVPDYVRNLFNLPVVAYSGELDKQKHAADIMAEAFTDHGQTLVHLIGPGMGHKYADASWQRGRRADDRGGGQRARPLAAGDFLQTRTLRYPRLHWVEALGLAEHWRDARIDARFADERLAGRSRPRT